jgi:tetratricopeptide (TPR) repeat protein/tRNA A-37 threonylcarbamoyl transferase component Bud32
MSEDVPSESDLRFGQLVVSAGFVTPEQVRDCLRLRYELQSLSSKAAPRLSELLVGKGYLTAEQADRLMRSTTSGLPAGLDATAGPHALPPEAATASQIPGNVMGRYVRVRRLGEGGMGEVWRAWDRDLHRWVALKFLRIDNLSELTRFQREAQTVAKLSHPNIAAIYDVGDHGGRPYIAMQFIDGPTLNAFPAQDLRLIVRLVHDACLGVHHAHENGIIHRDLKPQNILVEGKAVPSVSKSSRTIKSWMAAPAFRPYVVDFGLAKETAVNSTDSVAGNTVGTPPYMSPEQVRGGVALDARSDVYSLGATLYELCAGQPPFRSSDPYDLFKMIVERDPVPVRRFNSAVDVDLENIILRCLEKDPSRRYASALELSEELERYLDGEPVLAKPAGFGYRIGKRIRKHVALTAALGVLLLAVGTGAAVIVAGNLERQRERKSEEESRRGALEAAELSRRAQESVKEAKALWRIRSSSRSQWESLLSEAETMTRAALEKHPTLAAGHYTQGEIWQSRGFWQEAIRSFKRTIELDPDMPGAWYRLGLCRLELYMDTMLGPGIIEVSLAEQEGFARREYRAEPHKQAALAAFRRYAQLRGQKEESSPLYQCSRAAVAIAEGKFDDAEKICNDILATTKTDEQVWLLKAMSRCSKKDYAGAIQVLDILIQEVMPQLAQAHYLQGWIREKQQNFPAAKDACSRALELNPLCVAALVTRSWARCGLSDEPGMIEDATRAIEIDPSCAPAYYARGWARERRNDLKGAAEDYGKIVELHPHYAPVYTIRGWTFEKLEEWKPSLEDYLKAVSLGSHGAHDFANCGRVRVRLGDQEGAIDDYTRAIRQPKPEAVLFVERGRSYLALKKYGPALADFREAVKLNAALQTELAPLIAQCESGGHR